MVGAAAGGSLLVLLLLIAGVYAFCQKRRAERATEKSNPFGKTRTLSESSLFLDGMVFINHYFSSNAANWDQSKSSGSIPPQLKGARRFTFEEVKKCTNNFSEANKVGSGGYGEV